MESLFAIFQFAAKCTFSIGINLKGLMFRKDTKDRKHTCINKVKPLANNPKGLRTGI